MKQNNLNIIEAKNLSFEYEGEKAALKDVNFKLQKGSLVFVAGIAEQENQPFLIL